MRVSGFKSDCCVDGTVRRATRMVSPTAYEAGETAGASLTINPGIRGT
jgi:hypothetical protein